MKNMFITMTLTALFLMTGSCSKDLSNNSNDTQALEKGNYTFLKSAQAYNEAIQNRSEVYSASFDISKVERIGDTLNITVSFLQGCEVSKFEVVWNGITMMTYPATIALIVKRSTSNCGSLGDTVKQVLSINLTECIGDASLVKDANILVSNASKRPGTDNADIPISNRN
jgi:hypothetical protein